METQNIRIRLKAFDHRVLDGEGAGRFTATLKRFVEQPLELMARLR